jgi:hypothetical protein
VDSVNDALPSRRDQRSKIIDSVHSPENYAASGRQAMEEGRDKLDPLPQRESTR